MTSLLQTDDGDIAVTSGRLKLSEGLEEKRQKINNRLGLFRGEWFLDSRVGTPWWEKILGIKNPDLQIIKRVLVAAIQSVPGIESVEVLDLSFANRQFTFDYVAIDETGERIEGGSGVPFVSETK